MVNLDDKKLIELYIKENNEAAFEALVKRYLPIVYGFVRKYIGNQDNASDITQEVFVKVWKNLKKFNPERNHLKNFRAWIFTIAKRTAIDWLRKKNALPFSMLENGDGGSFVDSLIDSSPLISEQILIKENSKELKMALTSLPLNYATVINLRVNSGLNFREIAESLNESINTVKSRYRRSLSLLKKTLSSKN